MLPITHNYNPYKKYQSKASIFLEIYVLVAVCALVLLGYTSLIFYENVTKSNFLFVTECDQTFVSRVGGPQNGTFTAPLLHNPTNHSRQCLYIFLAGPRQRVEVAFTSFNLRGNPPE